MAEETIEQILQQLKESPVPDTPLSERLEQYGLHLISNNVVAQGHAAAPTQETQAALAKARKAYVVAAHNARNWLTRISGKHRRIRILFAGSEIDSIEEQIKRTMEG